MESIERTRFGQMDDGSVVDAFTLRNASGLQATILTYGATIAALAAGGWNVVLGFPSLEGYRRAANFGSTVGRYANRIGGARFTLDGVDHRLPANQPPNTLHGGPRGFDKVVWRVGDVDAGATPAVELLHVSPDGDQGFPGRMEARVRYTLAADALRIDYTATADRATVVNLTNHSYFNLTGSPDSNVLGHELMIDADSFTPVDATLIPTGEIRPVAGTPFDFSRPTPIGARIGAHDEQLRLGGGYDHNFVLRHTIGEGPELAARVREPATGLTMEVWTTEPGVQFYSGNFLDDSPGRPFPHRHGFCLETQHFPDSPNKPAFPSSVLRPGETFRSTTLFRFP